MADEQNKRQLGKIVVTAELDTKDFEKSLQGLKAKINDFERDIGSKQIHINMFDSISKQSTNAVKQITKDTDIMAKTINKSFNDVSKNTKVMFDDMQMPEFKFQTSDLREPEDRFRNLASQIKEVTKGLEKTKALISEEKQLFKEFGNQTKVTQTEAVNLNKEQLEAIKERGKWIQLGVKQQQVESKEQKFALINLKDQLTATETYINYKEKLSKLESDTSFAKNINSDLKTLNQLQSQLDKIENRSLSKYSETLHNLREELLELDVTPSSKETKAFISQFKSGLSEVKKSLLDIEKQTKETFRQTDVGKAYQGLDTGIRTASKNIKASEIAVSRISTNLSGISTMIGNINKQQSSYNTTLRQQTKITEDTKQKTIDALKVKLEEKKVTNDLLKENIKNKKIQARETDRVHKLEKKQIEDSLNETISSLKKQQVETAKVYKLEKKAMAESFGSKFANYKKEQRAIQKEFEYTIRGYQLQEKQLNKTINAHVRSLNKLQSELDKAQEKIAKDNALKEQIQNEKEITDKAKASLDTYVESIKKFSQSVGQLSNNQMTSNMKILEQLIAETKNKINLTTLSIQKYKLELNGLKTINADTNLQTLNSQLEQQKSVLNTLTSKLEMYNNSVVKVSKNTNNFATGVKYLSDQASKMSSKFKRAIWSTLRWSLALSGMSGVFWALRTSASDIINSNEKMQASIKGLTQAFGQALKPIIDALVPVFQKMVVWTTFLINAVITLTNTLFNLNNAIITSFSPLPGKIDKSTKAMAKLKKQVQKTIAPFDQLNIISNLKMPDNILDKEIVPDFADMNQQLADVNKHLEQWGKSIEFLRGQGGALLDWAKKLGAIFLTLWGVKKIADFINMVKGVANAFGLGKKGAEGMESVLGKMSPQQFGGAVALLTGLITWGNGIYKQFFKADASLGTFLQTLGGAAGIGVGLGFLTGNPWIGLAGGIAAATVSLLGFTDAYNKNLRETVDKQLLEAQTLKDVLFYEQTLKNITQLSRTAFRVENPDALKQTISTLQQDLEGYKKELEKIDTNSIVAVDENKYKDLQRKIEITELKLKYYNDIINGVDVNNIVNFKKDALIDYDKTMKTLIDKVKIFEMTFSEQELKGNLTYLKLKKQLESFGYAHESVYRDVRSDISTTQELEERYHKNSEEGWDGVIKKLKEFGRATLEVTKNIGNWIIDSEKNQSESWGDARYRLPSQSKIKPSWNPMDWFKIPKFANGGVVKSPTLGMVGEYSGASSNPEIISPQSTMENVFEKTLSKFMSTNNNDQPIQLDMTVNLGGTQVGHSIIKLINSTQRVYGKTMIEV